MNVTWHSIRLGDEVTWLIKSDYRDGFETLEIYPHEVFKREQGEPVMTARLKPLNPALFFTLVLEQCIPHDVLFTVEVPLTMLLPVIRHTIH